MQYNLIRSRRKTLSIYIKDNAVEVRAPLKMPLRDIEQFIMSKEQWITDKLALARERANQRTLSQLDYGSEIILCGIGRTITAKSEPPYGFNDNSLYIPTGFTSEQIKAACVKCYRAAAKYYLPARVEAYAQLMGVDPQSVKINGAKKRWGSCSSKKSINFSWRLIMADDAVIDYVVVHELAHLVQMNHSPKFWQIVENTLPDYRERRARLKNLAYKLNTEDWG